MCSLFVFKLNATQMFCFQYFKSGTKPPTLSASHKAQSKKPSGNGGDKGKEGLVEGEMEGEERVRKEGRVEGLGGKGERGGEKGGVGGVEGKVEKEGENGRGDEEGEKVEEERETEGEVVGVEQSEGASEHKETDKEEDGAVSRKRKRGMVGFIFLYQFQGTVFRTRACSNESCNP